MEEKEERVRTRVVELVWVAHQFPWIRGIHIRAEQSGAEQSRIVQSRAEQSRAV